MKGRHARSRLSGPYTRGIMPVLPVQKTRREILHFVQNDNGAVQNDNRAVQNDNGAARNDNGAVQNDNGAVQNDNGAARNDNGRGG